MDGKIGFVTVVVVVVVVVVVSSIVESDAVVVVSSKVGQPPHSSVRDTVLVEPFPALNTTFPDGRTQQPAGRSGTFCVCTESMS